MTWQERIAEAAYTSPSGQRLVFDYEDVGREIDKKTSAFNFPDADGTYVQDLGKTGRRYPLRVIFYGNGCDLSATTFEGLLAEKGAGKLEHPMYGDVQVVPFGGIRRRDALKTAANQVIIEVTFWETIGVIYPTAQTDPASSVLASVEEFNAAAAEELADSVELTSAGDKAAFKNSFTKLLDGAKSGLQSIADAQDSVRESFNTIFESINSSIDILVDKPLDLAFQTVLLAQTPARSSASVSARLEAYADLAAAIFSEGTVSVTKYDNSDLNSFLSNDLYANSHISGMILSAVNAEFETSTAALAAADDLLTTFDSVVEWRDDNYAALGALDPGVAYQAIQSAVAIAAGFLVSISFSLKQERRITLDRNRTIIDLVAELYGSVDDQLDFFIKSNSLSGGEILELPAGREVVYYV